jgi:hypothetical protein
MIFEVSATDAVQAATDILDCKLFLKPNTEMSRRVETAVASLDLLGLNHALFRCDREEESTEYGTDGAYEIPGFGSLMSVPLT